MNGGGGLRRAVGPSFDRLIPLYVEVIYGEFYEPR